MIHPFKGLYPFTRSVLENWSSSENGVYYIGVKGSNENLIPYYIGKGCGDGGMRSRLIEHLGRWKDVTYFGYHGGTLISEIETFEISEIKKFTPRYNIHHT